MILTILIAAVFSAITSAGFVVMARQRATIARQSAHLEMTHGNLRACQDHVFMLQKDNHDLKMTLLARAVADPVDPAELPESHETEVIERWLADET